jgi:hypothetical protein
MPAPPNEREMITVDRKAFQRHLADQLWPVARNAIIAAYILGAFTATVFWRWVLIK